MGGSRVENGAVVLVVCFMVGGAAGQDKAETCYGPGSVAGAVAGTLIVTVGLLASAFFLYKMYWKNRKGKHLVLMSDAENPHDQYAFDNPCFREATAVKHVQEEKQGSKVERNKWTGWPPVHTFGKQQRPTSMDDSCVNDPRLRAVTLKSHDFTGLGFNICGNMRDGIFVKDVLHRGPAFESGCINTGDRIDSVCISFRNMVFEDALTILSYASPYDVQVQVENDSCSRPSTLMRSKRESNAVNCSDRILHPKFTRSQSASQLKEMRNNSSSSSSSKKVGQQVGSTGERNRVNYSQESGDYGTMKVSSPGNKAKSVKTSPVVGGKESPRVESRKREVEPQQTKSPEPQNKLHKFGIKVLPISINPKMGVQSVTGTKRAGRETSPGKEKQEKPEKAAKPKELSRNTTPVDEKLSGGEETDANKENMKAILAKGFLSLKEKINQNTLGRKRRAEEDGGVEEEVGGGGDGEGEGEGEVEVGRGGGECPVPRRRSSVTCEVKAQEQRGESQMKVPEEVYRAGDVARSHRKSGVVEGRKSEGELEGEGVGVGVGAGAGAGAEARVEEGGSESEGWSDREWTKDETKRPKRSKGKAPSPPKPAATSKEMKEIKTETELYKDETRIFEPETKVIPFKDDDPDPEEQLRPNYDSDSDNDPIAAPKTTPPTKIELNATQVTVHHSPIPDANDDDVEPNRKAASLGDLSRLDSDQPLSIVLERAVSLDLTEGTSHTGGKKRKAPLPPSEEFPNVFDDLTYRKEPRLEGLSTFQRRLKKSSDFGTLEDAFQDESKPSEPPAPPHDLSQAHTHNIQEFSSWLAECRRPKPPHSNDDPPPTTTTSLININSNHCSDDTHHNPTPDDNYHFQGGNVSFRVNGADAPDNNNLTPPSTSSRTVVVISQPNSLEPPTLDNPSSPNPNPNHQATNGPESPPKLPDTPIPTPTNTVSSPLSSPLTYVTEIKVSTPDHPHPDAPSPSPSTSPSPSPSPSPNSVAERIHTFDSLKPLHTPPFPLPIRTMKSETGQRILATIQTLAMESSHSHSPSRKIPPIVPPRKIETSLPAKSTVTVALPPPPSDTNVVTFSSFVTRPPTDDPSLPLPSKISFNLKPRTELNGRGGETLVPVNTSATNIVFDVLPHGSNDSF